MSEFSFFHLLRRNRVFARLFWADCLAQAGEVSLWVAFPLFVYERTGEASHAGAAMAGEILAVGLLSPVAGNLADRGAPERQLRASAVARQAVLLALLWVGAHQGGLAQFLGLSLLLGVAGAFFTPARAAFTRRLLEGAELTAAVAAAGTAAFLIRMFVPAFMGVLLAFISPGHALLCDLVAYLVVLVLLAPRWVRPPHSHGELQAPDWRLGWQRLAQSSELRGLAVMDFMLTFLSMAGFSTMLALLEQQVGVPARYNGWLMAANGLAGAVGTRVAWRFSHDRRALARLSSAMAVAYIGAWLATSFWQLIPLWLLRGWAVGVLVVKLEQRLVANTPPEAMGRVQAAWNLITCLAAFGGSMSTPIFIDHLGAGPAFGLFGLTMLGSSWLTRGSGAAARRRRSRRGRARRRPRSRLRGV
ncbi:MAG: MFS transporter [Candidatus Eremiobacteraeota bacterium]|nr:MFS transporter [Candidatus Eremiobacteraeota bacterium]